MKKFLKVKESGITLIALVITIVVLLILASVSIATLTGQNGILTQATKAKEESEIASVKEQVELDITNWKAEKLRNNEDATVNTPEKIQEILNEANKDNTNKYYKGYTETGITTPSGYEIPYEELYNKAEEKSVEELIAGEKVYYDTGIKTIGNDGIVECIVLYDKKYNEEKEKNYGIQVITTDTVENNITLGYNDQTVEGGSSNFEKASNSYNNAIKTLNGKAEKYLNNKYASSARCVGSVPDNKNSESEKFSSEYEYLEPYSFKGNDTNYETDYNQMNKLGISNINKTYWLASRAVNAYSSDSYFGIYVMNNSKIDGRGLCAVYSTKNPEGREWSADLRLVFTLKPTLKVTEGNGANIPYTLLAQ